MGKASMNHVYRLVWSDRLLAWVAVPEGTAARGKSASAVVRACASAVACLVGMTVSGAAAWAAGLPTGGQVVQGSGQISQAGNTLTITQGTQKLVTNWDSFNVGTGNTVRFVQPNKTSVALNRVLGSEVSLIQGALISNGQVFLLNPNGILFSKTAQVDTGGLIASTLDMSDADFLAGRYHLAGSSTAAVVNEGRLKAVGGGLVALVAATVRNVGVIQADGGMAALASGQEVEVDLGGPVKLVVTRGAIDSLIENGGAVQADGGVVLFTAKAADALSRSVINQTGLVRARTLSTGQSGEIELLGDMQHGELYAGGVLDASAPVKGHGGFIETSAASVSTMDGLLVNAGAASGQGGLWLIDPYDYTITSAAAGTIGSALSSGTSVTVSTQQNVASYGSAGSSSGSGDITVNSAITKTGGGTATLTLLADRNINVASAISSSSGKLNVTLSAANNASSNLGGVNVGANINSNGGRILIGGAGGNQTTASSYGIGYALNYTSTAPAVQIGTNVSITSGGGDITINGRSSAANSGSYSATRGGVYVLSGATVDTGGGNLYISGVSAGAGSDKVFGFGVEANAGTTTTFRTSTGSGVIVVDAQNLSNSLGALGLVNNGNQARVQFWAPSVAHMLFRINGDNKATQFTISPPCQAAYPNCGTMVIPGGNQSYTSAMYNAVNMAMTPLYVFSGNATRTYDGTTDATGLTYTSLAGPAGFTVTDLGTLSFSTDSKNVGSYTSLTSSPGNPSSYTSGGTTYAVAYFNQGTYTITPKTISSFTASNKVYDGTTAANVTGSGIVTGDAVTINATGGFSSAGVGNGIAVNVTGVSLSGADAGNYVVSGGGNISTTANITPAPLTVTAGNASKTYDGQTYSGGNGVSYSGFVNGEGSGVLTGSVSYGGDSQGALNAGSYTITPSGLSAGNYSISYVDGALSINPATLTYTAGSASRTYGSSNPSLSGSVTGFVNGETLAGVTSGNLSFTTAATSTSGVGSYAVDGSGLSANHGNYVFVQAAGNSGALTVTPAPLTVTAGNASKTYDGQTFSGGNGVSYSGFVNGEGSGVLTGSVSYGGDSQGALNAGSYTITPSGLSAGNYSISYVDGALTINPATLTYTAGSASRTYGSSNPSLSGSVTGFVNGETLAGVTTGTLSFTTAATGTSGVGSYAVDGSGLSANHGNYVFVQAAGNSGALTVTPAPLTVTAGNASKTYDGQTYSGGNGVSYSGFVNGEGSSVLTGSLSYGGDSQGAVNAGSYTITPSGLSAGNYSISYVDGSLTINPATLSLVTISGSLTGVISKVYDGTTTATLSAANYLLSGWVGSDGATVTKTSGTYDNVHAGEGKTVTVSLTSGDFTPTGSTNLANYVLPDSVTGDVGVITPASLIIRATTGTKTYDGTTLSLGTPVVTGLVDGDAVTHLSQAYTSKDAGTGKTIRVSDYLVEDGHGGGDYTVTTVDATDAVIDRAQATVIATGAHVTYNGATQTLSASSSGFLAGDDINVSGTASARNTGHYVSSLSVAGSDASNYDITITDAALVIDPATLTLTATSVSRVAGAVNPPLTGFVSGFVGDDSLASATSGTLQFTSGANTASPAGSYAIEGSGLLALNGNYVIVQASGNATALRVTAAPPSAEQFVPKTSPVPNFPDNALLALGSGPQGLGAGNLNYVSVSSAGESSGGMVQPASEVVTGDQGGAGGGRVNSRAARPGMDGTAVPSSGGPLDVFVVDGGINMGRQMSPQTASQN